MDFDASNLVSSGQIATIQMNTKAMATISNNGDVAIDWKRVEEEATGSDRYLRPVAQALIAVRDKTYKQLP
jgi:hypothetical protein